jgi:hypothetical protein
MTKTLIAVYATGGYGDQVPLYYPFELVYGWIYGELVRETADMVVIAHQVFDSGEGRHISTIPKSNIIRRREFPFDPEEEQ